MLNHLYTEAHTVRCHLEIITVKPGSESQYDAGATYVGNAGLDSGSNPVFSMFYASLHT